MDETSLVFGPIPSRRLGQSLGINHVPVKSCTYDCIYCQVGKTTIHIGTRQEFYNPDKVINAVKAHVHQCKQSGAHIDYLTFVPDGEPTLDIHLGTLISELKCLGIPIAVITNATLINDACVRQELIEADWVSVKCDSASEKIWKKLNRPVEGLSLDLIFEGIKDFSHDFKKTLTVETMLVKHVNDHASHLTSLAEIISTFNPEAAYLGITTRPPTESWAGIPDEKTLLEAYTIFESVLPKVEILTGYSPETFQLTGDVAKDLLNITCVHPVRHEELLQLLAQAGEDYGIIETLIRTKQLKKVKHREQDFYIRVFNFSNN